MDPIKTGKIICEKRRSLALTQRQLANMVGVSDKAVSKWERGLSFPDITVLIPLSETLGVSLYDLLKGETMSNSVKDVDVDLGAERILESAVEHYSEESQKQRNKHKAKLAVALVVIVALIASCFFFKTREDIKDFINAEWSATTDAKIQDYMSDVGETEGGEYEEDLTASLPLTGYVGTAPFGYLGRTTEVKDKEVILSFDSKYSKVVGLYGDSNRVKYLMVYDAVVVFTISDQYDSMSFVFADTTYTFKRKVMASVLGIADFSSLKDNREFSNIKTKFDETTEVDEIFSSINHY